MKKRTLTLSALLITSLLLCSCGNKKAPTVSVAASAQSESTAPASAPGSEETVPTTESTKPAVNFGLGDTVTNEGFCEMSNLNSEVLDDEAVKSGWYYYYTDSKDSPANVIEWKLADGEYTTVQVLFSVKNISDKPQTFRDKFSAKMYYQASADAPAVCFDGFVFQQNPDQYEKNGAIIMWSTNPVEIPVGEIANVSFRFNIPKDVYEKVYKTAIGEKTGIVEKCEVTISDGTTYVIDLTKALVPASQTACYA